MKFTIVIASLLGVFLAPALADRHSKKDHGENSHRPLGGIGITTDSNLSEAWKSIWDVKTGYVATKVFSKNTCIIAKMDDGFLLKKRFPAASRGHKGPGPHQLPPRENRFIISRNRLQNLRPYGKSIQALCRGIPSFLAYPTAGSNFLNQDVSCMNVKIKDQSVYYCD